ncbi:MAG: DUF4854 domain-containing protein [Clostridia bacterium]|nr:DUF4854 domain-containing protein [Clostridia bacterium]
MTKFKNKLLLGIVVVLAMGLSLCACGGGGGDAEEPLTLEKYAAENADFQDQLNSYSEQDDSVVVTAEGNNLVFTYDTAKLGISEEMAQSDSIKNALNEELDKQKDTFVSTANTIKNTTDVPEVNVVVKYMFGDQEIVSQSFAAE